MQNDLDPKGLGETEGERLCRERAMSQWEASTKRPDLDERARVLGAIQAYQRQAFVLGHLSATVPAGDGELVERLENIIAHRIDLGSTPRAIAEQCAEAASRLSQGTGVTDAQVLRLAEENEALTQNAESLLEIIDMRKASIKALEHEISVHRGAIRRLLDEKGDLGSTMFAKGVLDRKMPALSESNKP